MYERVCVMENKYLPIRDDLKKRIILGQFQINQKLPTESELMSQYKVSRYTVRRAIEILETEQYVYKIQGGGIFVRDWQNTHRSSTGSKLIGVVTTQITNYIFPDIINGIDQVLSRLGYSMILSATHNTYHGEKTSLTNMMGSNVAGLIIEPTKSALPNPNLEIYHRIQKQGIPMIFINSSYPTIHVPAIHTADFEAERQLINYLFSLGHQRILGVFEVDDLQGINRLNGFVRAYQEHPKLTAKTSILMYQAEESMSKIFSRLSDYFRQKGAPTAIACYNDQMAIKIIKFLTSQQIDVPKTVSVVGFDNYQMGSYLSPGLTTVNHEKERMGRDAAQSMIKLLENDSVESITYPAKIIKRQSAIEIGKMRATS